MNRKIIIIGCGISGATLANRLANNGWNVTIYDKNNFVGGNCYDSINKDGILIHNFGPHIFHTNDDEVYSYITKFTKLNNFVNRVLVNTKNKLFPLPINFRSIEEIMGNKAHSVIKFLKKTFSGKKVITLFELRKIRNKDVVYFLDWISKNVYFNYSAKMWGMKFEQINPDTINRVKIVLSYNHNYFPEDRYQGLPSKGYTDMIKRMLNHKNIKVVLKTNALNHLSFNKDIYWDNKKITCPLVYCGPLDELLEYKYGMLPYRSLNIRFSSIKKTHFQQTAVINYPADKSMTRIAEYKWMTMQKRKDITTISKEYPGQFDLKSKLFNTRYYPIVSKNNQVRYEKYYKYFKQYNNFIALGRLAQYKYFDMDDAIKQALDLAKRLNNA